MMYDVLFLTDEHMGCSNGNKLVFEEQMRFYEQQLFPYILQNNISHVVSLGDITDKREYIDLYILQELKQRMFGWFEKNKVNIKYLLGNHSCYHKNTTSHNFFVENFNEYKYCTYIDTPTTFYIGKYTFYAIPWVTGKLSEVELKPADICLTHSDMKGMRFTKGIDSKAGFDVDSFAQYHYVLNGHMHIQSRHKNVINIGNPYQKDFGDFLEPKGFFVLKDNFELEFVENILSPKHIKIFYSEKNGLTIQGDEPERKISDKEAVELNKSNYCKIIILDSKSQKKFDKFHESMVSCSKNNYKVEVIEASEILESVDMTKLEENVNSDSNELEIINAYSQELELNDIDPIKLNECFETLYKEVLLSEKEGE